MFKRLVRHASKCIGLISLAVLANTVTIQPSLAQEAVHIDKSRISVQLYSARKYSSAKGNVDYLLRKLAEIGYPAVELAGFWNLSGTEWREMLDRHNLKVSSVHTNQFELAATGGVQKVIDNMRQIGSNKLVYAYTTAEMENTVSRQALIDKLKLYKRQFADAGIELLYHNHNMEFVRTESGGLAYDDILKQTQMNAELDVHWAARAGVAPALQIDKLGRKLQYIHLKDLGLDKASSPDNQTARPVLFKELGNGNLDWNSILAAAKRAGCNWYVIEQDDNFTNDEPLESLKISFDFLTKRYTRGGRGGGAD